MSRKAREVTRRQVLIGTSAITASLGAARVTSAKEAQAARHWHQEADILVVGSGVGACTAAITAHEQGDSVIMVEKAPFVGGTSMKSAGVLWVPDNFTLKMKGIEDRKEDCLRYMARFSYPERYNATQPDLGLTQAEYQLLEAFYDNSSKAIDRLREVEALKLAEWRMFALDRSATDYLDHVPENKVPAGRALAAVQADGQTGLGAELMAQLERAVRKRPIPLLLGHRVVRLVMDDTRRVVGVEADAEGKTVALRARKGVIFASGGFVHNQEFANTYLGHRLFGSCAMPSATGDFIRIASAAGARLGNMSGKWGTQIVLEEALMSRVIAGGVHYPPGDSMIQVNRYGKRAVNEKRNYNDRTNAHGIYDPSHCEYPNQLLFMIYDQRSAEAFAGAYPFPADPNEAAQHVLRADSLHGLASRIGARLKEVAAETGGLALDASFLANLKATIARFNGFAKTGMDEDFGRGSFAYDREWQLVFSPVQPSSPHAKNMGVNITMYPLSEGGPYYAIILAAGALDTNGGPVIDASARVLDKDDKPIAGLYGAGNCIASPSRFAYYGAGHTLAHSLTFGYIAANSVHRDSQQATT